MTAPLKRSGNALLGTMAFGGPRFLSPENVARIHTRPDEAARRQLIFKE